jgi:hypothetical protein
MFTPIPQREREGGGRERERPSNDFPLAFIVVTNDTFLIQKRKLLFDLKEMTEILCERLQQKHPSSVSKVVLRLAFNFSI